MRRLHCSRLQAIEHALEPEQDPSGYRPIAAQSGATSLFQRELVSVPMP